MKAYIPPNYDDDGGFIGGLVDKRRAIDAGVYLVAVFILLKILKNLGAGFALRTILFFVIGVPVGILLLIGIDQMPISVILYNRLMYKKHSKVVTLRPPQRKRRQ